MRATSRLVGWLVLGERRSVLLGRRRFAIRALAALNCGGYGRVCKESQYEGIGIL